jgi:hypothetical protein
VLTYTNGCSSCCEQQCLAHDATNATMTFLDEAHKRSMHVLLSIKDLYPASPKTEREWRAIVSGFKHHPALLGWYINDENGGASPTAEVIDMYATRNGAVLAADPNHVTTSVVNRWVCTKCHWPKDHYIGVYENTSLVIGADPYPWKNTSVTPDLSVETWELQDLTAAFGPAPGANPARASLCVAQFFDYGAFKPAAMGWTEPPFAVKRAMTWLQPVLGCGGVLHYCYKDQFLMSARVENGKRVKVMAGAQDRASPNLWG